MAAPQKRPPETLGRGELFLYTNESRDLAPTRHNPGEIDEIQSPEPSRYLEVVARDNELGHELEKV